MLKLNINILTLYIIQPPVYVLQWHGCLKLSEINMWKKSHHLIGQLLEVLPCNLISQHAILYEARWMLTSDSLFKFPLVHEVMVHGIFGIIFHGFWWKILSETITDVSRNYTPS